MNVKELRDKISKGKKFEYILFWDGPYSQWADTPFTFGGITYKTAEHYMMFHKAKFFKDEVAVEKIMATHSPKIAKQIGREIKNYDDTKWAEVRYNTVVEGNMAKFTQDNDLRNLLLSTDNKIIVEASPFDTIWGIGMGKGDNRCKNPLKWKGQNLLGFAIMEVRDILQKI